MTTTTDRPAAGTAGDRAAAPPRLRRRPAVAAIGVALIAFGSLGAAALAAQASDTKDVVALSQTVPRGQQIQRGDLAVVAVNRGQGLRTVPAADLDSLVGQWAKWDMLAGSPLNPEAATPDPVPGPGQALVGLSLTPGQLPSVPLRAGDTVVVVATPRQQDDPAELPPLAATSATVAAAEEGDSGSTLLNVAVGADAAQVLAARAATGRIAVILAGPEG